MDITETHQKILRSFLLDREEKTLIRIAKKIKLDSSVVYRGLEGLVNNDYAIKTKNRTYNITEKGEQLIIIIDTKLEDFSR